MVNEFLLRFSQVIASNHILRISRVLDVENDLRTVFRKKNIF
jgi:hypothetical protein